MNEFREELLVLISIPIYTIVIGIELLYSYFKQKGFYSTKGILSNIYLTSLNLSLDILVRGICLGVLWYFQRFQFTSIDKLSHPIMYWTLLLLAEDFMFYWMHRIDHYCRFFWGSTRHSSFV